VRPKGQSEPEFSYLDRSARPEAFAVRELVDDWLSRFPASAQADWRGRFRSDSADDYHGAFFELMTHEWLVRLGYGIEPHPAIPNTAKRPDFKAVHADDRTFYLEAKSTDGNSSEERRVERFCDQVLDAVASVQSDDYFLDVRIRRKPNAQPAPRAFADEIRMWLKTLDYDNVRANFESFAKTFAVGGGEILLVPFAKNRRGSGGRWGVSCDTALSKLTVNQRFKQR